MWKIPVVVALFGLCFQQVCGLSVLPNTGCGPVCKIGCLYGNVLDERGCPTCQCKPGPSGLGGQSNNPSQSILGGLQPQNYIFQGLGNPLQQDSNLIQTNPDDSQPQVGDRTLYLQNPTQTDPTGQVSTGQYGQNYQGSSGSSQDGSLVPDIVRGQPFYRVDGQNYQGSSGSSQDGSLSPDIVRGQPFYRVDAQAQGSQPQGQTLSEKRPLPAVLDSVHSDSPSHATALTHTSVRCAPLQCEDLCPGAHELDTGGCPTCACKSSSSEPQALQSASFGQPFYLTNAQGQGTPQQSRIFKEELPVALDSVHSDSPSHATALTHTSVRCAPLQCEDLCPGAHELDTGGCPTCACKSTPATLPATVGQRYPPYCGPVCRIGCPYGNVLDSRGCPLCRCKPAPGYPPRPRCGPVCAIFCPYGNVVDARGCPTCRCRPAPGPVTRPRCGPVCNIFCANGNVLDLNGCPTCQCRPAPERCQPSLCGCKPPLVTQYRQDSNGCPVCFCQETNTDSQQPKQCPPRLCGCRPPYVTRYTQGSDGCPVCSCEVADVPTPQSAQQGCPPITCPQCYEGSVVKLGADGCSRCECRSAPRPPVNPGDVIQSQQSQTSMKDPPIICKEMTCERCVGRHVISTDSNGCRKCECQPISANLDTMKDPPIICKEMTCERCVGRHVISTDSNGCRKCECQPISANVDNLNAPTSPLEPAALPGLSSCPQVQCPVCSQGYTFTQDSQGCTYCNCKNEPATPGPQLPPDFNRCPQIQCPICPGGFKYTTDEKGCNYCSCKDNPLGPTTPPASMTCPEFRCPDCPGPIQISADRMGCSVCRCRPPSPASGPTPPPDVNRCPQVQCPICPNGYDYTTDANGCNFCSCKPPLNAATPLPPDFNRCPQIQCPICPGGFKYTTDEKGCNYCSCKDTLTAPVQVGLPDLGRRCPKAACPVCPAGFDYPMDSNGCSLCVCKTAPAVPVPPTPNQGPQCGPVCLIFCPYGNVMDARGCPTCTCRPRPPPRCLQPRETGRCRAAFPSFYYDTRSNRCQNFIYGGCGGNQNRFSSLQECQAVCERNQDSGNPRVLCPDIRATCRRYCWLGFEKDANGCETCQCRNLFPGFSGFF